MPVYSNTDAGYKPAFDVERQVREVAVLYVTSNTLTTAANTVLTFSAGTTDVTNAAIANGYSVYAANVGTGLKDEFFTSNTTVVNVTANTVTLSQPVVANVYTGSLITFGKPIAWKSSTQANTYNKDTILVTPTRLANAKVSIGHTHTGWVHVQKTTNGGDGATRYREEVLVALSNSSATLASSGNTSTGQIYTGV